LEVVNFAIKLFESVLLDLWMVKWCKQTANYDTVPYFSQVCCLILWVFGFEKNMINRGDEVFIVDVFEEKGEKFRKFQVFFPLLLALLGNLLGFL